MGLDTPLNVLLAVTGFLQLGALATRIARRSRSALAMAGTNAAVALGLSLMEFVEFLHSHDRIALRLVRLVVILAPQVAAAVAAAIGLAKRSESGWLFWPVWVWNFAMIYALVYLRFFFHLYF